jgi:hypothetical protein
LPAGAPSIEAEHEVILREEEPVAEQLHKEQIDLDDEDTTGGRRERRRRR